MAKVITEEQVAAFVARCQAVLNAHTAANFSNLEPDLLEFDYASAQKFCRVVSRHRYKNPDTGVVTTGDGGSAWCFINLENGDVLKPDGWKRPAKHARGNILDADGGVKHIGPYGPAYLK